jgi:hypothetical protein
MLSLNKTLVNPEALSGKTCRVNTNVCVRGGDAEDKSSVGDFLIESFMAYASLVLT